MRFLAILFETINNHQIIDTHHPLTVSPGGSLTVLLPLDRDPKEPKDPKELLELLFLLQLKLVLDRLFLDITYSSIN